MVAVTVHTEAGALLWLLIVLAVLVVGQATAQWLSPVLPSASRVDRWLPDMPVFAAAGLALAGMFASMVLLLPWGVMNTFVLHLYKGSPPDVFWTIWLGIWSLLPCVVLGYRSGRWWAFLGAAPVLVLWPIGAVFASGPADWFLGLPVTAAVAVALSLGSGLRVARSHGGQARRPLPI